MKPTLEPAQIPIELAERLKEETHFLHRRFAQDAPPSMSWSARSAERARTRATSSTW